MIEVIFGAIPFIIGTSALCLTCVSYFRMRPTLHPQVVLVRAPYGFPKTSIEYEMKLEKEEQHFQQGPLYHLQFPISSQSSIERAMVEIGNRLSPWKRYISTSWFLIHSPETGPVSLLETMLTTHGYTVNVMDVPIPTNDGFPTSLYYKWAESCRFIKNDENLIQSYHSSWQSWQNTGKDTFVLPSEDSDSDANNSLVDSTDNKQKDE